jgi:DMSO/TMAO reductase YedYZ molybdopterin-dependent catalytic subunit
MFDWWMPARPSRREVIRAAAQFGLGAAAAATLPVEVLAQALPGKDPRLVPRAIRPPDYETPVALLDDFITPVSHFYVRSHMPAPPPIDGATWTLEVDGEVATPVKLTVADLRAMPATTVTVTLECAGNGRAFFDPPVPGIQWARGAVGTARWTGVRIGDLLKRAGMKDTAKVVVMNGGDRPPGTMPDFVRQVPLAKAMHPDTIVAYEMNGAAIPAIHGFPLRAIVPGWEGAYAVKWLASLHVAAADFDGFWVATGYRYPTKRVAPGAAVEARDMAPLTGLAVKSLITRPLEGSTHGKGRVEVAGFAWAGEHDVAGVDISIDHGATWQPARLTGEQAKYTWRRFEFGFDAATPETTLILSRATDAQGRQQPMVAQWNPSGYLWNQPDIVRIEITG